MTARPSALCVCSTPEECRPLSSVLVECELEPVCSFDLGEAAESLTGGSFRVVVCEEPLSRGGYSDLLHAMRNAGMQIPLIVSSRVMDWPDYLKAVGQGVFDVVARPYRHIELKWVIGNALSRSH